MSQFNLQPKVPKTPSFTPAKAVPNYLKPQEEDAFEFFENKDGKVFFRRKVLPGSAKKLNFSSAKKPGRSLGNSTCTMMPQRMIMSTKKTHGGGAFGKSPQLKKQQQQTAAGVGRTPLAQKNSNQMQPPSTRLLPPRFPGSLAATEKKATGVRQPVVTRQVRKSDFSRQFTHLQADIRYL